MLTGIEIRLFLVIDAFSRFSGIALACSADLSLALAKQLLDSTAAGLAAVVGPQGRPHGRLLALLQEPASHPQNYAVPHPRQQDQQST